MPLELFFDLVFVLALTQCTTLMSHHTTWGGLGEGILVFGLLWWSWGGYAWLTSVLDPEEGAIRIALFCAMASFLIAAICVPEAFGGLATEFAVAYGGVRLSHRLEELGYDRRFRRLWELYFAISEAGFREARLCDVQMLCAKREWSGRVPARAPRRLVAGAAP